MQGWNIMELKENHKPELNQSVYKEPFSKNIPFKRIRKYIDSNRDSLLYKTILPIKLYLREHYRTYDAFYFPEINAVFYHSLKSGGTSIITTLMQRYDYILMKKREAVKLNAFNFTFVRNPYGRVVSGYFYLLNKQDDFNKKFKMRDDFTFEEYVKRICEINDKEADNHFKSLSEHHQIKNNLGHLHFIGKLETAEQDFQKVCNILRIKNLPLLHKNKTKHQHWKHYYTNELREMVYNKYFEDFINFGYDFIGDEE